MDAIVYRCIRKNAFTVHIKDWPGFVEIHCTKISPEFENMTKSVSAVDINSLLHVSVTLGEYSLSKRAFVDCELVFNLDKHQTIIACNHETPKTMEPTKPPGKKRLFTAISQNSTGT
jgi:hypothetical protein